MTAFVTAVKKYISAHPAGLTAIATSLLVAVLSVVGVEITAAEAASVIAVLTGVVSHRNPKTPNA